MLLTKILAWFTAAYGVLSLCAVVLALVMPQYENDPDRRGVIAIALTTLVAILLIGTAVRFLRRPGRNAALSMAFAASFVISVLLYYFARQAKLQQWTGPALAFLCLGAGALLYWLLLKRHIIGVFPAEEKRPNQSPQRNAGSRPSPGDSSASGAPSSLGPRG